MRYQNAFTRGCSYSVPRIYPFRNARLGRCFRGRRTITIFPDLSLLPQLYSRIVPRQLHFSLVPRVTFSSHSSRFTNDSFKRSLSIPLFSREIRKKKIGSRSKSASKYDGYTFFEKIYARRCRRTRRD